MNPKTSVPALSRAVDSSLALIAPLRTLVFRYAVNASHLLAYGAVAIPRDLWPGTHPNACEYISEVQSAITQAGKYFINISNNCSDIKMWIITDYRTSTVKWMWGYLYNLWRVDYHYDDNRDPVTQIFEQYFVKPIPASVLEWQERAFAASFKQLERLLKNE